MLSGALSREPLVSVAVELTHYRLSAITGTGEGGGAGGQIPMGGLGKLVEAFNERFGADLSETELVKPLEHIVQRVVAQEGMAEQAKANELDDSKSGKEGIVIDATPGVQDMRQAPAGAAQRPVPAQPSLRRHPSFAWAETRRSPGFGAVPSAPTTGSGSRSVCPGSMYNTSSTACSSRTLGPLTSTTAVSSFQRARTLAPRSSCVPRGAPPGRGPG